MLAAAPDLANDQQHDDDAGEGGEQPPSRETALAIPAGDYVVHVSFGLASAAKRVALAPEVRSERLTLSAGAVRIEGTSAGRPVEGNGYVELTGYARSMQGVF